MNRIDDPIERKVQLTGGSTYTISLPKDWANDHGIEPGATLHLRPIENRLLVTQNERGGERTVSFDAGTRDPTDLSRVVSGAYVAGAERIVVTGPLSREQTDAIRDAVAGHVGIEVYEQGNDRVVARTMLDVRDLSAKQTVRQMEGLALSMHTDAVSAALAGDADAAGRIVRQDDDVDRLFGLVTREFQTSIIDGPGGHHSGPLTAFDYYAAARQLERVADHAEKIANVADRVSGTIPTDLETEIETLARRARDVVTAAVDELFGDQNPATFGRIVTNATDVVADIESLDRELYDRDLEDGYLLGTVLDSLKRTAKYGVNVAEAGIQATLREPDVGYRGKPTDVEPKPTESN